MREADVDAYFADESNEQDVEHQADGRHLVWEASVPRLCWQFDGRFVHHGGLQIAEFRHHDAAMGTLAHAFGNRANSSSDSRLLIESVQPV